MPEGSKNQFQRRKTLVASRPRGSISGTPAPRRSRRLTVSDLGSFAEKRTDGRDKGRSDDTFVAAQNLRGYFSDVLTEILLDTRNSSFHHNGSLVSSCVDIPCVAGIADLSGFCAATEKLCAAGPTGLDALRKGINESFSSLLSVVREHGGDVLDFAGDALIISWGASLERAQMLASRSIESARLLFSAIDAVHCALKLVELNLKFGPHKLELHVGLAVGNLNLILVGGEANTWRLLTMGPIYADMVPAVEIAKAREVVISEKLYNLLGSTISVVPVTQTTSGAHGSPNVNAKKEQGETSHSWQGRGLQNVVRAMASSALEGEETDSTPKFFYRVEPGGTRQENFPSANKVEEAQRYESGSKIVLAFSKFLPAVVELVEKGTSELSPKYIKAVKCSSEIRTVTVIFLKIAGSEVDQSFKTLPDYGIFNKILNTSVAALSRHQGYLRQYILDDKGLVLIGAFGVSKHTHIDDATRALDFTLETGTRIALMGLQCFAGVTTGKAYCGLVGDSKRHDFAMVGDVVNLSARLMSLGAKRFALKKSANSVNHVTFRRVLAEKDLLSKSSALIAPTGHVSVICDSGTKASAIENLFTFKAIERVKVKGKQKEMTVHQVLVNSSFEDQTVSFFVGLQQEMNTLKSSLRSFLSHSEKASKDRASGVSVPRETTSAASLQKLSKSFSTKRLSESSAGSLPAPRLRRSKTTENLSPSVFGSTLMVDPEGSAFVCCIGAQGEGKSTFLRAARQEAIRTGFKAGLLRFHKREANKPFCGILKLLRFILLELSTDVLSVRNFLHEVEEMLSPTELVNFEHVTFENALAGADLIRVESHSIPELQYVAFQIFAKCLMAPTLARIMNSEKLFIAVDDMDLMDDASWALFRRFLSNSSWRVFVCTTYSSHAKVTDKALLKLQKSIMQRFKKFSKSLGTELAAMIRKKDKMYNLRELVNFSVFGMDRPSDSELFRMIKDVCPAVPWDDKVLRIIVQTAQSNPFISKEIARIVEENWNLKGDKESSFSGISVDESSCYGALAKSYQSRLDNIDSSLQSIVKVISVLFMPEPFGKFLDFCVLTFSSLKAKCPNLLAIVDTYNPQELEDLCELDFLRPVGIFTNQSGKVYAFMNDMLREACCSLLLTEEQVSLHSLAATWYTQRVLKGGEVQLVDVAAKQYILGGDSRGALKVLFDCLARCWEDGAHDRCLLVLEHVYEFFSKGEVMGRSEKHYAFLRADTLFNTFLTSISSWEDKTLMSSSSAAFVSEYQKVILRQLRGFCFEVATPEQKIKMETMVPVSSSSEKSDVENRLRERSMRSSATLRKLGKQIGSSRQGGSAVSPSKESFSYERGDKKSSKICVIS